MFAQSSRELRNSPRSKNSLADFQLPEIATIVEYPRASDAGGSLAPVRMKMSGFVIVAQVDFLRSIALAERPLVVAAVHRERMIRITVVVISHLSFRVCHLFSSPNFLFLSLHNFQFFFFSRFVISFYECIELRRGGKKMRLMENSFMLTFQE